MQSFLSAPEGAQVLASPQAPSFSADYPINRYEMFRAEILARRGKPIVSISRWKFTPEPKRTGVVFEFAARRTLLLSKILRDLETALSPFEVGGAA